MRYPLLVSLLLITVASPSVLAQTNCTRYIGGEITCTGHGGYQVEAREHINGQTSYYDNRGNVGTVNQHPNGGVSVTPTQIGRSAPSVPAYVTSGGLEPITPPSITPPKYCPLCEP